LDFAYQGFADGIDEDAVGLRSFARPGAEMIVCSSFSKNFGLYCERVGALTVVAKDKANADAVQSQVKVCIRANYSNPPAHGAELVTTVLGDGELRNLWEKEVAQMRNRINGMCGLNASAGRSLEAEIRDLHRGLRPHQRRWYYGAKCRTAVRGNCQSGQ
jgi:aspartate aminotransferase